MAATLELIIQGKDQASAVIRDVEKSAGGLNQTLGTGLKVAAAGAAVGVAGLGAFLVSSVKEAMDSQKAIAQLESVLKSTGGAAGLSKEQMLEMAAGFQKVTAFSDEAALEVQNLLLTFTNIGAPVFKEATGLALDMSTALGKDLSSSSIQLGKALHDPITGMTALRRAGVSFTEDQVKQITALQESGDLLGAQKVILGELSKEFGGSAAAAADTFGGRMSQLKNALSEVQETVGFALLPILTSLARLLAGQLPAAMEFVQGVIGKVQLAIHLLIAGFREGDVTSSGWHGTMERIGKMLKDDVLPPVRNFGRFLKDTVLPAIKDFVSNKTNIIALGGAVAALFAAWAISAGIAAIATIAAAAPLYILIAAIAGLGAAIAVIEAKTGFFSEVLLPALKDVAEFAGPILGAALTTLKQGWEDLQPALESVAGFLEGDVLPILRDIGAFIVEHKPLLIALAVAIGLLVAPWLVVIAALVLVLAKWDEIKTMFTQTIPEAIDSVINKVQGLPIIGAIFTDTFNTVWTIVTFYVGLVQIEIETALAVIRGIFMIFKGLFTGDWDLMWQGVKTIVEGIWNGLAGIFGLALDAIKNMLDSKLALLTSIGGTIGNVIAGGFTGAVEGVKSGIVGTLNWIIDRINDFIGGLNKVIGGGALGGLLGKVGIDLPEIPKIPHIGGGGGIQGQRPGFQEFQFGGLVPGMRGMAQLAVVHGGERVLTPEQQRGWANYDYERAAQANARAMNGAVFQIVDLERGLVQLVDRRLGSGTYLRSRGG